MCFDVSASAFILKGILYPSIKTYAVTSLAELTLLEAWAGTMQKE